METAARTTFFPQNLENIFYHIKSEQSLRIYGSCTGPDPLAPYSIFTRSIEELTHIDKAERFLTAGSAVTLYDLMQLGPKRIPEFLHEALESIANPYVRNVATIGGNICMKTHPATLFAPMLALDALFEFRSPQHITAIPATKYTGVPEHSLLTRIKIPLGDWDIQLFRRLGPEHIISSTSGVFVFLASTERGILSDIRIAFSGRFSFRCREIENNLQAAKLPLSNAQIAQAVEDAAQLYDSKAGVPQQESADESQSGDILRCQFINLIRSSLRELS